MKSAVTHRRSAIAYRNSFALPKTFARSAFIMQSFTYLKMNSILCSADQTTARRLILSEFVLICLRARRTRFSHPESNMKNLIILISGSHFLKNSPATEIRLFVYTFA